METLPLNVAAAPVIFLRVTSSEDVNETAPVDDKWKGIGIRIENDILTTKNGFENLTPQVPVEIDEIEQLMQD